MSTPSLPHDEDFERFISWLRDEIARLGITPENQPKLIEFLARRRPVADPTIGALPPHNKPSSPLPPAMTQVEALAIGQNAGNFVLTGAPDLSAFDLPKVESALELLHELAYSILEGTKQGQFLRAIFMATSQVHRGLKFDHKINRARGPQKSSLKIALAALPDLIADSEGSGGEYWRNFARQALAEVREIWDGER